MVRGRLIWKSPVGLWRPGPFVVKMGEATLSHGTSEANQMDPHRLGRGPAWGKTRAWRVMEDSGLLFSLLAFSVRTGACRHHAGMCSRPGDLRSVGTRESEVRKSEPSSL